MDAQAEFETIRRESASWWYIARRKLLREAVGEALRDKRAGRVLDLGCAVELDGCNAGIRVLNAHSSRSALLLRQMEGWRDLACTRPEELGFLSNSFDAVVAGDILQTAADDRAVLRELRRVLKDGSFLCLTVPAYTFLWSEEDAARGHQRRYTASEMRRKLHNAGFEISRISYVVSAGFLPAVVQSIGKNMFSKSIARRSLASAGNSRLASAAMVALLDVERHLIRYVNLPFGTRLVCWARKPAMVAERVTVPAWERHWARGPLPQGSNRVALPDSVPAR